MPINHGLQSRREEAMRLITLARSMLESEDNVLAVTHLDLAFEVIFESHQAEAHLEPPAMTAPAGCLG